MSIELAPTISAAPVSRWKPYPAYWDSGVEWLGEVPKDWKVKKIKRMCLVKRGASPRPIDDPIYFDDDGEYSWVRISDVTASTKYLQTTQQKLSVLGKSKSVPLEPGELFLSIAGSVGKPILAAIKCCIHDGFVYFVGLKQNRDYMYYIFLSGELYKGLGKFGTQLNLNTDTVGDIKIPAPSFPEQRAIANFLDRETGRIDTLIEKKERQIELLQEKRAALISHAVTKGLDPDVRMKDSGVEWLGEVPEGWKVRKLKHIASVKFSNVDKKTEENEQSVFLCNYVDVYYNDYITSDLDLMKATASVAEIQNFTLREGDILITKDSESWDDIAIPAYVSSYSNNVLCGYHLAKIRPNMSITDGEYLFRSFYARGINNQFRVAATGVTRYGLGKYWLDNSLFLVPPLPEQRAIAAFLDRETGCIDTLTTKVRDSISKLREYRTALISAAVTGKIDVRSEI